MAERICGLCGSEEAFLCTATPALTDRCHRIARENLETELTAWREAAAAALGDAYMLGAVTPDDIRELGKDLCRMRAELLAASTPSEIDTCARAYMKQSLATEAVKSAEGVSDSQRRAAIRLQVKEHRELKRAYLAALAAEKEIL